VVETERGDVEVFKEWALGKKMTQTCARRWQHVFRRWPQGYMEQPKGVETKLKILDSECGQNREVQDSKEEHKVSLSVAKGRTYEELYQCLSMKEGEKDIYRMARVCERKTKNFNQVKCIKNEAGRLLVKEDKITHRWQEYFEKLFNGNEDTTFQLDDSF
jgi:hypothetical protein